MLPTKVLLSLLPLLATIAPISLAHPHHHHMSSDGAVVSQRKTLGFGPRLSHAQYKVLPAPVAKAGFTATPVDAKVVAMKFIEDLVADAVFAASEQQGEKLKQEFFIRPDSYKDPRTKITHVYAKQVVNGLEVLDGDINLNIDEAGNVLSYGDSFYRGQAPSPGPSSTTAQEARCASLLSHLSTHRDHKSAILSGAAAAIKDGVKLGAGLLLGSAAEEWVEAHLPSSEDVAAETVEHLSHHEAHLMEQLHALCPEGSASPTAVTFGQGGQFLSSQQALSLVLPRILPDPSVLADTPASDLVSIFTTSRGARSEGALAWAEPEPELIDVGEEVRKVGGINGDVQARLVYTQTDAEEGNGLALAWKFVVEMRENWYDLCVDVGSGEIVSIVDFTSDAPPGRERERKVAAKKLAGGGKQKPFPAPAPKGFSYSVFPWGINDPSTGNISLVSVTPDSIASPGGWHAFPDSANTWLATKIPGLTTGNPVNVSSSSPAFGKGTWTNSTTTFGNNVIAHEDFEGQNNWLLNYRPINGTGVFDFEYGEPEGLRPQEYIDFSVTQLFYTSNMYHDLLHRLGFDEISGNFQMENWNRGGKGGDAVICNAQDGSGTNNANFATPPDGVQPRMRMYSWSTATPYRDGDLEAGIVIHEYSHGLSTRLTGGPANSGCLGYGEAGGMGEGWGDAMATFIRQVEEYGSVDEIYSMGAWAANNAGKGIRNYKYSTNSTVNPSTYKTLDKPGYWGVHAIGEVWAEFLFVMESALIAKHGFSKTLMPPVDTSKPNDYYRNATSFDIQGKPTTPLIPVHGNTLAVQLIVDGMKLQPCRPSFAEARDAILLADQTLTGGENFCDIWSSFAARGLGTEAALKGQFPWGGGIREEDFTMPIKCTKKKPSKP